MALIDKMRVTSVGADTSGGTQDITISGFGTPTCAIALTARVTADTTVNHATTSMGFTDGTNEYAAASRARNGVNSEQADRIWTNAAMGWVAGISANPNNADADFSFNQWITDGIQITWNTTPSSAWRIIIILIQCANAQVGVFTTPSTQDSATTVTMSPVFPPQTVFIATSGSSASAGAYTTDWESTFGIADWNGSSVEQVALDFRIEDGSSVGNPQSNISNTRVRQNDRNGDDENIELNAFDSDSFDAVTRNSANPSTNVGYLSIEWNTLDRKIATFDAPGTPTGDKSFTWPGFRPQCVIQCLSLVTTVGTEELDADAGSQGIGIFDIDGGEECLNWADEDASASTNTETSHASEAVELPDDIGAALFDANFASGSMDATGYTLDFTAVDSTTRKWAGFALQEEVIAAPSRFALLGVGP